MVNQVEEKISQVANLSRVPKKVLEKEDFIKLFITQLQYQDPMKPIENHEMATQLALFNQVDQLFNLNDSLNQIKDVMQTLSLNTVSSLVGKKVRIESDLGRVEGGKFLGGEFYLEEPANKVQIVIKDETGKLVKNIEMKGLSKGVHQIEWDATDQNGNRVSDGNYYFSVQIEEGKNKKLLTPIMVGRITSAKLGKDLKLVFNEKFLITLDQVQELLGG
ncbi:MAG: hypothetical protein NZ530_00595 [Thermodesulfobacteriaceae bacterium]|nr:hypothetical protein [Thermodesulfobacteriaceae bacterium]MCX8040904.1 hypothetical protein [Thermodesulfobacteriaceae bacterium]MDW8136757.1 FlgD immunoglobulin-like domain containing protein [Thermodesulfobacterium sp.]